MPPPVLPALAPMNMTSTSIAFENEGPEVEVRGGEAGGGHHGGDLEERIAQGCPERVVVIAEEVDSYQQGCRGRDAEVAYKLAVGERGAELADEQQEIDVEVHAESIMKMPVTMSMYALS